ncbi:MAG: hypothetical protein K2M59_09915 [Muribaculaceae bacterium]|nr:hypothetical protein [Muribaculaceae bacterium]
MKGIVFIGLALSAIASIGFVSCYPKSHDEVYYLDYSALNRQGFYITESDVVAFDFDPVGSVLLIQHSGYEDIVISKDPYQMDSPKGYTDDIYGSGNVKKKKSYKAASVPGALSSLSQVAKDLGADGVINLKFSGDAVRGIAVSGMLIKRK